MKSLDLSLVLRAAQIGLIFVIVYALVDVHGLVIGFLIKMNGSATETQALIKEQRAFLKQQQALWNNPKTQESIGLILRQGNEFAKFMDHSQGAAKEIKLLTKDLQLTVREANSLMKTVRDDTLAGINALIKEATANIKRLGDAGEGSLKASTATINQLENLLKNQNVLDVLANIASTTNNIDKTSALIAISAGDINEGLPAIIKTFQEISRNIASTTLEIKTFAGAFNKPTPAYVKILRYLVAVLAPALPVLVKK